MLRANIESCDNGWIINVYGEKLSDGKRFIASTYEAITDILRKNLTKGGKNESK